MRTFFIMKKINIYIDGFNFYYGLKSNKWKKFYWLDFNKFFDLFLKENQEIENIFYFTASPLDTGKKDRQDLLLSANKLNPKFKIIKGKFLEKKVTYNGKQYKTFEEKQTDVNIAVEMIRNVISNKCDISIVVSADSDLIPPIKLINELYPEHKIFVYFPPKRYSRELDLISDAKINLERYEHRFQKSILEEEITLRNGYVLKKPSNWK